MASNYFNKSCVLVKLSVAVLKLYENKQFQEKKFISLTLSYHGVSLKKIRPQYQTGKEYGGKN